ncbi:preprotein translocase subunit SecG [Aliidiomarina haloalkalitolerans]|uniref:Protein-export membrane protein SecG n=1 Tax=Aliidiomarina haloalkalitolerans TaxID=859059 RepID=A0A432VZC8_9GAMM|nr:preprotein translocase subunit SecG [Aliidiomarina haloalkalitolerans]RUO22016.1 preprotein translocase subunit SecG [Aliidiomarina haloalkalitolerans]
MYETLLVLYLLVAIALIALIMIQQGKGADMGASFGAGASNTVFGSGGAGNFLTRMTAIIAVSFFLLSLILGSLVAGERAPAEDDFIDLSVPATQQLPQNDLPPGN